MAKTSSRSRAVFVDRDGTIIRERFYLRKIKDVKLLGSAVEGLKLLVSNGFKIIIVTNQSGVAKGYFTEKKVKSINNYLVKLLAKKGARVHAVYYCPHGPEDKCSCRKPKLGMIKKAAKRFNIDLKKSFSIGDHTRDVEIGIKMGGKGVFVLTGHANEEKKKFKQLPKSLQPNYTAKNFIAAARYIVKGAGL